MPYQLYQIIHAFSVIMLTGLTFASLAAPSQENRRFFLMCSGIFAVLSFVSGFGLLRIGSFGLPGWIVVKLACWLALASLGGLAYRRLEQRRALTVIAVIAVFIAVSMVVLKPF